MSFPRYAEYKDSGVEWLGEVPQGWDIIAIKRICDVRDGTHDTPLFVELAENTYPLITSKDLNSLDICFDEAKQISESDYIEISKRSAVSVGDILMPMIGSIGGAVLVRSETKFAIKNIALFKHALKFQVKWLLYILNSDLSTIQFTIQRSGGVQGFVALGTLRNLTIPFPPISEQTTIAAFLDHETAKLDNLINQQKKLIELLKEKRQAVISHAVTKGLNPNAPMKDSGVEWLGKVPEHWDVIKFDYAINTVSDIDHYMPSSVDVGIPYVMTGDLQDFVSDIDFESCKKVTYFDYQKLSGKIKTTKDDIIFARYATIGTLSYVDIDKEFLVSYSCVTIKPNPQRTTGKYLSYYLKSQAFLQAIQQQINSNTQGNVGIDSLRNVKILLPLLFEQEKIVDFLKTELVKMDNLIDKAESTIQLLQERRTALISAAVTGKIDVREYKSLPASL